MDWSKAKSILIIALIVTNSLLAYVLYSNQNNIDATTKTEFIAEAIEILNNKNIKVDKEILPTTMPILYGLTVEYELLDSNTLNDNFFEGNGKIDFKSEGLLEITNGNEILTLINNKLIIYESKSEEIKHDIKSEEQAVETAMKFLEDKKIHVSDMKLSLIKEVNGVYIMEFTKIYNDNYLESTFTNIQVDNTGVKKLERTWLNTKDVGANILNISSAPKSILALISMEEVYGKTVSDISICYYFNPEKQDYVDPDKAQEGSVNLAWRIQFDDGYKVFVDNYNY